PLDIVAELRWASILAKVSDANYQAGLPRDVFNAATLGGCTFLARTDLGRLAPGAKADIVVINLDQLGAPVYADPIKALVDGTSVSIVAAAVLLLVAPVRELSAQGDQVTWGVHVVLAPTWFDPAESSGIITPYMIYYALHDALAKPMPGQLLAPSLAESWTVSKDSLTYEFVLRSGARFHNGEPVTAEDVKFSFDRYRGAAARTLKERVAAVEI